MQTQWYPRVVEQGLAVTRHTPPSPPAAALASGPFAAVSEPASSVGPVLATPELVPPVPPLEIDAGLSQTLWRAKIQAEEQGTRSYLGGLTSWETILTNTAKGLGLDVMAWQTSIWQLQSLTRPCFIEVFPSHRQRVQNSGSWHVGSPRGC